MEPGGPNQPQGNLSAAGLNAAGQPHFSTVHVKLALLILIVGIAALGARPAGTADAAATLFGADQPAICDQAITQQLAVNGLDPSLVAAEPGSSAIIPSLGYAPTDMSTAIDASVGNYMNQYGLPGGAVAITYNDQLIFAKSYGYADVDNAVLAQPDTRFRTASVSKPLTAMAVLKLVHDGRLTLDDHPFPFAGVGTLIAGTAGNLFLGGPSDASNPNYTSELSQITIDDLLHHAGGWNRDETGAPDLTGYDVLRSLADFLTSVAHAPAGPPNCPTLLRYVESQPLQFQPGTANDYSNVGFCALSEVVRETGGSSYFNYLKTNVLNPLHMDDTTLGATEQSKRQDREAVYYSNSDGPSPSLFPPYKQVPAPYSGIGSLEALAGAGGIVSTAPDLAHFAGAVASGKLPDLRGPGPSAPVPCGIVNAPASCGWPENYYVSSSTLPDYECSSAVPPFSPNSACTNHPDWDADAHFPYGAGWDQATPRAVPTPFLPYDNYNFVKDGGYPGTLSSIGVTADGYGFAAVFNGDFANAPGPQWNIFWSTPCSGDSSKSCPGALQAAYAHAKRQAWTGDFSAEYAQAYSAWMDGPTFQTYLATQSAQGSYPSRLEGRAGQTPEAGGGDVHVAQYRGRFGRPLASTAPSYLFGRECAAVLNSLQSAPAETPLVSLQKFRDSTSGTDLYQAVWSAPIPQLPAP